MKNFSRLEKEFRALGNSRRLRVLSILKHKQGLCVSELADHIGVSLQTISKHLRILFLAGIASREQVGGEMHYCVSRDLPPHIKPIIARL